MHELRKPFLAVVAAMAIAVATAGSSADVLLLPQSSILWRTAPSGEFELPVILPDSAVPPKKGRAGRARFATMYLPAPITDYTC